MNYEQIEEFLHKETPSETWHILHPGKISPAYSNIPICKIGDQQAYYFDFKNTLLNNNMALIKETRYTIIPPHFHKDMEMNYIYEGSCRFTINGRNIFLKKGDICILESNAVHSAEYKGVNDIVINVVFRRSFFINHFFSQVPNQGIVMHFLMDSLLQEHENNKFLIFHTSEREQFHTAFQNLVCTYFNRDQLCRELLDAYIRIVFLELLNTIYDNVLSDY
ncbi:MAG TPA: AraC family transcriptional regulator, partial [Clostridiaceae bacterium]|nr:AraC family transcriptional regulator [Clostridiaceae bacterium]